MNRLVETIPPSAIRAINDRKRADAIDLGLGQPLLGPAMEPLQAALSWVAQHGCPYSPNAGFPELREAIAQHFGYPGLDSADSVCVTVGSQQALYLPIKSLIDPTQHEALVITPTFPAYQKLCHLEGVPVREVALDPKTGFAPDAQAVLRAVTERTRLVALASPCNPTGRVWPESELRALCRGLLALPNPPYLLSDEVYAELYFGAERPASPAHFYPHTLVASSLSKSCALTGLRLGWILGPQAAMKVMWKAHQFVVSCVDTIAQRAALEIFANPAILGQHRPHYVAQREVLLSALRQQGLSAVEPEGSFYCLIRLPEPWTQRSMDAALHIMETENVVTIPSSVFGVEGFLRVTFVAEPSRIEEGVRRIRRALLREAASTIGVAGLC